MASSVTIDVDAETNTVHFHELTVHDDDLVAYLESFDPADREEAVASALTVGAATLQLAETEKELEYVKREFEGMQRALNDEIDDVREEVEDTFGDDGIVSTILEEHFGEDGRLRRHIDEAFGEDGAFARRLDEELGEDGERIQQALDPDREGTPTYRLFQRLQDEIDSIRKRLDEEEGEERIRGRTTLKGDDFEEVVRDLLDDLVYGTPHTYHYTGDSTGELGDSKKGDFVIELGDTDQRIVIEAKSEAGYSVPAIKEEMEEALENRDAEYGFFVSECEAYVPNSIGYLKEFDNFVAVSVCEDEDDDIDRRLFHIGFNWAKMRTAQAAVDTGDAVDAEAIQTRIDEIEDAINRFRTIKRKCTSIRSTADEIDDALDGIKDDVQDEVLRIRSELTKAD